MNQFAQKARANARSDGGWALASGMDVFPDHSNRGQGDAVGKDSLTLGTAWRGKNQTDPLPAVDLRTKIEQCSLYVLEEDTMLRSAMEEVAALTSLGLFVSMIAIWAQVIAVL